MDPLLPTETSGKATTEWSISSKNLGKKKIEEENPEKAKREVSSGRDSGVWEANSAVSPVEQCLIIGKSGKSTAGWSIRNKEHNRLLTVNESL